MSTKKLTASKDHVTCHRHGGREATAVCGNCGDPLCDECRDTAYDPSFVTFLSGKGSTRLTFGVFLLIGIPVLYPIALADMIAAVRVELAPTHGLFAGKGLVPFSILVGFALLISVWFKEGSLFQPPFLVRQGSERYLCEDCISQVSRRNWITKIVSGLAAVVILAGLYRMVTAQNLVPLRLIGLGVALLILKDDIYAIATTISGSSEPEEPRLSSSETDVSAGTGTSDSTSPGRSGDSASAAGQSQSARPNGPGDAGDDETKYCTSCGAEVPANAKFCSHCGADLQ